MECLSASVTCMDRRMTAASSALLIVSFSFQTSAFHYSYISVCCLIPFICLFLSHRFLFIFLLPLHNSPFCFQTHFLSPPLPNQPFSFLLFTHWRHPTVCAPLLGRHTALGKEAKQHSRRLVCVCVSQRSISDGQNLLDLGDFFF